MSKVKKEMGNELFIYLEEEDQEFIKQLALYSG